MRLLPALIVLMVPLFAGDTGVARARAELLAALPANPWTRVPAEVRRRQNEAARPFLERLKPVGVRVHVVDAKDRPVLGVEVTALHVTLDSARPPVMTKAGVAEILLPPGRWRLHLAGTSPTVFATVHREVERSRDVFVRLDDVRVVRVRSRSGAPVAPEGVVLATPDLASQLTLSKRRDHTVLTTKDSAITIQAHRAPGRRPGYVYRGPVTAATGDAIVDAPEAVLYEFRGADRRTLAATLRSADVLSFEMRFDSRSSRRVSLVGLDEVVVGLKVKRGEVEYGFHSRVFRVTGAPRTFTGEPPFEVSVGHGRYWFNRFRKHHNTVWSRVFLREANGLLLRARDGSHTLDWEQTLDGKVRAKGTMQRRHRARTPVATPDEMKRLRYRIRVRGPARTRKVEVAGHGQTVRVTSGSVALNTFPELEPNAQRWADCVSEIARGYGETCPGRRTVSVSFFPSMPPGLAGWGGIRSGAAGYVYLSDGKLFGFVGSFLRSKLVVHEFGHAQGYGHGRAMTQAGNRAGRVQESYRRGPARTPEGNLALPFLDALAAGKISPDRDEPSTTQETDRAGILAPNPSATREDAILTWYMRRVHSPDADERRRRVRTRAFWRLTIAGYTHQEIEMAIAQHVTGAPIAWLGRLRGMQVTDERVAAAAAVLAPPFKIGSRVRSTVSRRWREHDWKKETDLESAKTRMLGELGYRSTRIDVLLAIATEHLRREAVGDARRVLLEAMEEGRRGGATAFARAADLAASVWCGR